MSLKDKKDSVNYASTMCDRQVGRLQLDSKQKKYWYLFHVNNSVNCTTYIHHNHTNNKSRWQKETEKLPSDLILVSCHHKTALVSLLFPAQGNLVNNYVITYYIILSTKNIRKIKARSTHLSSKRLLLLWYIYFVLA